MQTIAWGWCPEFFLVSGVANLVIFTLAKAKPIYGVYGVKNEARPRQKLGPRDSNVTLVSTPYSLVHILVC